ncbi:MAG: SGNH/GDSL hydrolase family protein [Anaerolineales bacterium]|nr:SGNH/GDSL hydrolase family protein [Anaerolineales bacterium]
MPSKKLSVATLIITLLLAACGPATAQPTAELPTAELSVATETPSTDEILAEQIATWEAGSTASSESTTEPATPTSTPAADQSAPEDWRDAPIIPSAISDRAIEIYLQGVEMGNDPHAFSKVGDCGGTPSWFLGSFDLRPEYYSLGNYTYLEPVILYFAGSWERYSIAVSPGFNTASVFAPLWADPALCTADEGPLQCEYRIHNPSIALIMLGTNDQFHPDEFEAPMREIIEYSILQGVLPVLASKPDDLEDSGDAINSTIYKLAQEYEVPFWNFWAAIQHLPDKGLQEDGGHLTWAPNFFDDEFAMTRGWPYRNLTALQMLSQIWLALPDHQTP